MFIHVTHRRTINTYFIRNVEFNLLNRILSRFNKMRDRIRDNMLQRFYFPRRRTDNLFPEIYFARASRSRRDRIDIAKRAVTRRLSLSARVFPGIGYVKRSASWVNLISFLPTSRGRMETRSSARKIVDFVDPQNPRRTSATDALHTPQYTHICTQIYIELLMCYFNKTIISYGYIRYIRRQPR